MSGPAVSIPSAHVQFGSTTALAVEHLHLEPGLTALLGPNGSGKSTLLRLVATVALPSQGELRIDGLDPADAQQRHRIRRRLGYLAQADGLPGRMRVNEFLDYVGVLKELPERRRNEWAWWALQRVGLDDVVDRRISSLSGGMHRRLALAQSLLGGPDLLVLDEPAASLDPEYRRSIASLLVELAGSATVVAATHHPEDVASVAHRVVVLDAGMVVFNGTPEELRASAEGRVWEAPTPSAARASWAVGPHRFRHVGDPPPGVELVAPTLEDGYLLRVGPAAVSSTSEARPGSSWWPRSLGRSK